MPKTKVEKVSTHPSRSTCHTNQINITLAAFFAIDDTIVISFFCDTISPMTSMMHLSLAKKSFAYSRSQQRRAPTRHSYVLLLPRAMLRSWHLVSRLLSFFILLALTSYGSPLSRATSRLQSTLCYGRYRIREQHGSRDAPPYGNDHAGTYTLEQRRDTGHAGTDTLE